MRQVHGQQSTTNPGRSCKANEPFHNLCPASPHQAPLALLSFCPGSVAALSLAPGTGPEGCSVMVSSAVCVPLPPPNTGEEGSWLGEMPPPWRPCKAWEDQVRPALRRGGRKLLSHGANKLACFWSAAVRSCLIGPPLPHCSSSGRPTTSKQPRSALTGGLPMLKRPVEGPVEEALDAERAPPPVWPPTPNSAAIWAAAELRLRRGKAGACEWRIRAGGWCLGLRLGWHQLAPSALIRCQPWPSGGASSDAMSFHHTLLLMFCPPACTHR